MLLHFVCFRFTFLPIIERINVKNNWQLHACILFVFDSVKSVCVNSQRRRRTTTLCLFLPQLLHNPLLSRLTRWLRPQSNLALFIHWLHCLLKLGPPPLFKSCSRHRENVFRESGIKANSGSRKKKQKIFAKKVIITCGTVLFYLRPSIETVLRSAAPEQEERKKNHKTGRKQEKPTSKDGK